MTLYYQSLVPEGGQLGTVLTSTALPAGDDPYEGFTGLHNWEIPYPSWDIGSVIGFDSSMDDNEYFLHSLGPPQGGRAAMDPLLRYQRWYSYYEYTVALFKSWDFVSDAFSVEGENPVIHTNITGHIVEGEHPRTYERLYVDDDGLLFYPTYSECNRFFTIHDTPVRNDFISLQSDPATIVGMLDDQHIVDLNSKIELGEYDYGPGPWGSGSVSYPLTLMRVPGKLILVGLWGNVWKDGSNWVGKPYMYRLVFPDPTYLTPTLSFETQYSFSDIAQCDVTVSRKSFYDDFEVVSSSSSLTRDEIYEAFDLSSYSPTIGLYDDGFEDQTYLGAVSTADPHTLRTPLRRPEFARYVGLDSGGIYLSEPKTSFRNFSELFRSRLSGFIVGTYESSIDAINNFTPGLDTNHLETIFELRSLLDPIDVLKGIKSFLSSGFQGGLIQFLKHLADVNLTYAFGIAPTAESAMELQRKASKIINRLRNLSYSTTVTLHGKTTYADLTDSIWFDPYTVSCRSKVRLRPHVDSYLPYIVPLKSLGLLPSLSNIWDLVPSSWLIDDFINIGQGLEFLDANLFNSAFEIESSTHSISVSYALGNRSEDRGFVSLEEGKSTYKLYNRYSISNGIPIIGPTTLPIFGTTLSGLDIYGSIVVGRV